MVNKVEFIYTAMPTQKYIIISFACVQALLHPVVKLNPQEVFELWKLAQSMLFTARHGTLWDEYIGNLQRSQCFENKAGVLMLGSALACTLSAFALVSHRPPNLIQNCQNHRFFSDTLITVAKSRQGLFALPLL
jgi:hypothetical protein